MKAGRTGAGTRVRTGVTGLLRSVLGRGLAHGLFQGSGGLGRGLGAGLVGTAALVGAVMLGGAAPEPDPVPRRWELDVEIGPLRVVTLPVGAAGTATGEGGGAGAGGAGQNYRSFVYLTYTVTNNSDQDLLFAPNFELSLGGVGAPQRSGREVPLDVTEQLKQSVQNPFVLDQVQMIGQLQRGREHSKVGLVVWALDNLAPPAEISLYFEGFSGETAVVARPDTGEPVTLRKTLKVDYAVPGTLEGLRGRPLVQTERRWIMR